MQKYRIGVDGTRSWTLERHNLVTRKDGTKEETWTSFRWYNKLENAVLDLFEFETRRQYKRDAGLLEAVQKAQEATLEAISEFRHGQARVEIKNAVRGLNRVDA